MLQQNPEIQRRLAAIDAAMRRNDVATAGRMAAEAIRLGCDIPQILVLAAIDALNRGDPLAALPLAEKARSLLKRDPEVLNVYGSALSALGRDREALTVFDSALRLAPDRPSLHYNRGCSLDALGYNNHATRAFEQAVALQPNHAAAQGRLAYIAMMRGDVAEARRYGEMARRYAPDEPSALMALTLAETEEKHFDTALGHAQRLLQTCPPGGVNFAIAQSLAGDALDGMKQPAEAFAAYSAHNVTMRARYRAEYERPDLTGARQEAENLATYFATAPAEQWRADPATAVAHAPVKTHVFLVGFPRSGTTLLEQVLDAHPDVKTMPERECLEEMAAEFVLKDGGLDRLALLDGAELARWRKRYWDRAAEQGSSADRPVFIDKLPLHSVLLCLVVKLFPDAKILFARRDPVDVVWSCFRRRFGMNRQMYELTSLTGAAQYYDAVMRLSELYRAKLGLATYDTVYERLVSDFEGETREICDFLGIDWREELKSFARTSRQNAPDTPSGLQVARGLYSSAVGQWGAYRKELAPILPTLQPWRARFGYE